jgi:hypothetical protein
MKNGKPEHYWRIHRRIMQRVWGELSDIQRYIIAGDADHTTEEYQWFESRVRNEAERLFNDPEFYMNSNDSFRYSRN